MIKLNFGCGSNKLEGWQNYDIDLDVTKPLPFQNDYANFILCEHLIEHLTSHEAYSFLEECHRVLKKNWIIRVCVPSPVLIQERYTEEYLNFIKSRGWGENTLKSAIKSIIFNHGHKSIWDYNILSCLLKSIGFKTFPSVPNASVIKELSGIDGHSKAISSSFNEIETIVVEGIKRS